MRFSIRPVPLLKKYWTVLVYVIVTSFLTDSFYHADTFKYIDSILHFENGVYDRFLEFSHILWRPFGYIIYEAIKWLPEFLVPISPRLQVNAALLLITWTAALSAVILLIKILCLLSIKQWVINATTLFLIFSNAFLNFSQEGSPYVPGFTCILFGTYFLIRYETTGYIYSRYVVSAGLGFGLAVCFWIPYLLSLPAALMLPMIHFGYKKHRMRSSLFAGLVSLLIILMVLMVIIISLGLDPFQAIQEWVVFSKSAAQQLTGPLRVIFGFPKSLINMTEEGVHVKRFLLDDPYNPISFSGLILSSLWKPMIFYLMMLLLFLLFVLKRKYNIILLLILGLFPMLVFATAFDGGANERYFPLLPFLFITMSYGLYLENGGAAQAIYRFVFFGFMILAIWVNMNRMYVGTVGSQHSNIRAELEKLSPSLRPGSIIFTLMIDDLIKFKNEAYDENLNTLPGFNPVSLLEINTGQVVTWRHSLGDSIRAAWVRGGDVWLRTRLLAPTPKEAWNWVEGDDPRVHWEEIYEVMRSFEVLQPLDTLNESFVLVKRSPVNIAIIDSLSKYPS